MTQAPYDDFRAAFAIPRPDIIRIIARNRRPFRLAVAAPVFGA